MNLVELGFFYPGEDRDLKGESFYLDTVLLHSYFINNHDFLFSCHSKPLSLSSIMFGFLKPVSNKKILSSNCF